MAQHKQTQAMIRKVAEYIASRPKASRGDVIEGLGLAEAESTVYRWMDAAVSQGLLTREGVNKAANYVASVGLRTEIVRRMVREDVAKRPRVGYNAEWLQAYEPNKTRYLRDETLNRLMKRCPPGSAPLESLNDHEVSVFMCDLSYASSRLEGNEYDYVGTIKLLEHQIEKENCSAREKCEILNHRDAVRYLINGVREAAPDFGLSSHTVRSLHALLSADLLKDKRMCGNLRTSNVAIAYSAYVPPFIPAQITGHFETILGKASRVTNPFEQSFFLLLHLPYLQPFEDCNKRTARVGCNLPLLQGGVTPISWMDAEERQYKDALLAIYEHNEPLLMEEIFAECFLRSAERFSLMQRQQNPDPVAAKYRQEIRETIRARVLDDEDRISPNIPMDDVSEFLEYIDTDGLTPVAVHGWAARREQQREVAGVVRERERA